MSAPESTLTETLLNAWSRRYLTAVTKLGHARRAPALFTPERVAQLEREVVRAQKHLAAFRPIEARTS